MHCRRILTVGADCIVIVFVCVPLEHIVVLLLSLLLLSCLSYLLKGGGVSFSHFFCFVMYLMSVLEKLKKKNLFKTKIKDDSVSQKYQNENGSDQKLTSSCIRR